MLPFPRKAIPTGRTKPLKTHYKIITGTAVECEYELNEYKVSGKLYKIVVMFADCNLTTILVELHK